ncbi:putative galacturonosyltransferase 7 [Bienertia sinuspersici]
MKNSGTNAIGVVSVSTKRRWRGFVIAVMGLVILSMLVPLVFLLGFHNAFHSSGSGFPSEQQSSSSLDGIAVGGYESLSSNDTMDQHDQTRHIKDLIERLAPALPKNVNISKPIAVVQPAKGDENEMSCELRFGSYCLWRHEHKEDLKDSMVRKLKDRLFVARAYYPSIAKLPVQEKLSREMRQNIQDFERMLSESSTDADLPLVRAKSVPIDCNNVDKKFRQLVDLTEDEANFHTKQSSFLYQLGVQTMPKSLHCLSMRLTVEYFHTSSVDVEDSLAENYRDPTLYHYAIFSNNILASSVAINSTVVHAKESEKLVFHVLTDRQNYYAMKLWFIRNTFKKATIQVLNIEEFNMIPEYVSLFSHSHYFLPEIFKNLDKIVVLDDDIVVQQDLSALWRINMGRMVNGATELCAVRLGQLDNYLGRLNFNKNSCAWMSGLNVIDLARWRELNLTETFRRMMLKLKKEGRMHEAAASRATLLTFQDLVYVLDDTWVQSGLGHDYGLDLQPLKNYAVLHYNGNMKPWLELGIRKYKSFWVKYLSREDLFLSDCNVNR